MRSYAEILKLLSEELGYISLKEFLQELKQLASNVQDALNTYAREMCYKDANELISYIKKLKHLVDLRKNFSLKCYQ